MYGERGQIWIWKRKTQSIRPTWYCGSKTWRFYDTVGCRTNLSIHVLRNSQQEIHQSCSDAIWNHRFYNVVEDNIYKMILLSQLWCWCVEPELKFDKRQGQHRESYSACSLSPFALLFQSPVTLRRIWYFSFQGDKRFCNDEIQSPLTSILILWT